MKRLYSILLLFLILSPSPSIGGSFYNPDPDNLRKKGQEAAEKLNASFVNFYQMLENIEGNKFAVAKQNKEDFDNSLKKDVLPIFNEIHKQASDATLQFKTTQKLERDLNWIKREYYKGQDIDTQKKLTELPIILIGRLFKESTGFELNPNKKDFFQKLRSLIVVALDVQYVGLTVSDLWDAAIYK
jgi:hypothetical protein